jgi:hypothetical protein
MSMTLPGKGRAEVKQTGGALEITIPARKNPFVIVFLFFWLCGWGFGESMAIKSLFKGSGNAPAFFLLFWLCGWTVGGFFAMTIWLWSVLGKEIVSVNSSMINIAWTIGSLKRIKSYKMSDIKNFKVLEQPIEPSRGRNLSLPGVGSNGVIAFDYGMKTIYFGGGLDPAEGNSILELLRQNGYIASESTHSFVHSAQF